jgi:tetratricopeptide (TPR) repeat protein
MGHDGSKQAGLQVLVAATLGAGLLAVSPASAEMRTISATGEYRMGDNDTRMDAKRLSLMDAKRLALEQVGTYLEGVTEVKNLKISRDDLRTYTAGIVEVMEQAVRTTHEGDTTVVRVDVTVKIDTDVVTRQIEALRAREHAKEEVAQTREENERLRHEVEAKTKELAALKSKTGSEALLKEREQVLTRMDANDLVIQSLKIPVGPRDQPKDGPASSQQDRAAKKVLLQQAVAMDPTNPRVHLTLAYLLQSEGDLSEAIREYRKTLQLNPNMVRAHAGLGQALLASDRQDDAAKEFRLFLKMIPDTPDNERLILLVRQKLRDLGYLDLPPARASAPPPPPDGPMGMPPFGMDGPPHPFPPPHGFPPPRGR